MPILVGNDKYLCIADDGSICIGVGDDACEWVFAFYMHYYRICNKEDMYWTYDTKNKKVILKKYEEMNMFQWFILKDNCIYSIFDNLLFQNVKIYRDSKAVNCERCIEISDAKKLRSLLKEHKWEEASKYTSYETLQFILNNTILKH